MKNYKLVWCSIPRTFNEVSFYSSHQDVVEWLGGEAQKIVPTCRIDTSFFEGYGFRRCNISKADKRGCELFDALFCLLLDTGWEPFHYDHVSRYHLRLEVNT